MKMTFCTIVFAIGIGIGLTFTVVASGQDSSTASITGRILSTTNGIVSEIEIQLQPPAGEITLAEDGRYEISGLLPGSYLITVTATGCQESSLELEVAAGERFEQDMLLDPAYRVLGEITVNSSFSLNRSDPAPGVALDRQALLELPHVGDDVFRVLPLLPGVAAGDSSAKFSVRGGLPRELLFEVDGIEIYEPYHLKDFEGVMSIVDPRVLDEVRLLPGGFTTEYGDRSAAVLDLATAEPSGKTTGELGISFTTIWGNGQGGFADGRGGWFASVRRGFLDLLWGFVGPEDSETEKSEGDGPAYWDVNGMLGYEMSPGNRITGRLLFSGDSLKQEEWEIEDGYPEYESWNTSYGNSAVWLIHDWVLGDKTFASTVASTTRVDRDRHAAGEDYVGAAVIRDEREFTVFGLRQDWSYQASPSIYLKWGFDLRSYDAEYDYENRFTNFNQDPEGVTFVGAYSSTNIGLYAADRFRLGNNLTAEIGARWDRQDLTDENQISPRLNLVWSPRPSTVLRAGWGHFFQSHRPHELQVEDGETEFWGAERAEHRTLGFEHTWRIGQGGDWSLRAEAYQRLMDDVRPRYENLFDPFQLYPETSYDRYRIAPDAGDAIGAELFLARRGSGRFDWWANYAYSEVTDLIDGRDVPRQFDQTHALTISATWRPTPKWTLSAAWLYHTGWPTTGISGILVENPNGEPEILPVLGPTNGERLPDYHRLDLRVARRFDLGRRGFIELFLDIQNAYDRTNVSGYAVDDRAFSIDDYGDVIYTPREEYWLGILPSLGVSWSF